MDYNRYAALLGKNYEVGVNDCFSLLAEFYYLVYGIQFPNYARPEFFYESDLNLVENVIADLGLIDKPIVLNQMREGDILCFRVSSNHTNHIGVYVGNNLFIHHLRGVKGREDNLDQRWFRRITRVLSHPDVPETTESVDWLKAVAYRYGSGVPYDEQI